MQNKITARQQELCARVEKCWHWLRTLADSCGVERMHIDAKQLRVMANELEKMHEMQYRVLLNPEQFLSFGE